MWLLIFVDKKEKGKMRNFWFEAKVDGRKHMLASGPRRKDGAMQISLYQRDNGESKLAVLLSCTVDRDGMLVTDILPHGMVYEGEDHSCSVVTER